MSKDGYRRLLDDMFNPERMSERVDMNPDSIYGIICRMHGKQGLTRDDYMNQMYHPDSRWICPQCGDIASWDDDRYEVGLTNNKDSE